MGYWVPIKSLIFFFWQKVILSVNNLTRIEIIIFFRSQHELSEGSRWQWPIIFLYDFCVNAPIIRNFRFINMNKLLGLFYTFNVTLNETGITLNIEPWEPVWYKIFWNDISLPDILPFGLRIDLSRDSFFNPYNVLHREYFSKINRRGSLNIRILLSLIQCPGN